MESEKALFNWFPGHMNKAIKEIQNQIPVVDLIIEIVDARAPYSSQNPIFKRILATKSKLIIFTKCDLADQKVVESWKNYFESNGNFVFLIKNKSVPILNDVVKLINQITLAKQNRDKSRGIVNPQINVLVIGVPNVGKSTVISRLSKGKELKIGNKPGVTRGMQRISLDKNITLIDTPGILPSKFSSEKEAINLAAINAIKREVLPQERFVFLILQNLYNNYKGALENYFGEKLFFERPITQEDTIKILELTAMKNKWAILDGVWDIERVMEVFIIDLFKHKIPNISFENPQFLIDESKIPNLINEISQ
ncbi:ribosomal biogenesis GTPase [Spiroplasma sabaudiense Ar-1343]|uniref:Ribosome biogenesis GTPase A n=1 Tax=Spiroplasma sabaudiense Ar-1343 TaxID=1276257 RepID=W6A970_9MOLU|nr:ribosome biogenesis GTPase YlqF [Spiroplasma sabaudiense]AHI53683.1 ribosomal biogenesis GTPase [Spiroplasma sabaudiense Ar-1343]